VDLKETIREILSDKKVKREGLHVKYIAMHVLNINSTLFSVGNDIGFDGLKRKVNRILANDVKKRRNNVFMKVVNPKTNKYRKGVYKLNPSRLSESNTTLTPQNKIHKNREAL